MSTPTEGSAIEIRIRGRVQGVGFRPTAWRVARELGLAGEVLNDGEGVLLRISGDSANAAALLHGIRLKLPPLARIDEVESKRYDGNIPTDFRIAESAVGGAHTQVAPDALICAACAAEIKEPEPAPIPISLRQLHALRPKAQHCQRHSLRPLRDDDGGLRVVRRVPPRI